MWNIVNRLSRVHLETVKCKRSVTAIRKSSIARPVALRKPNFKQEDSFDVVKWLVLVIPVGSFGLGCWQVKRLQWKLDLLKMLKSKTSAEPVPLPEDYSALTSMEFEPVRVRGHFLHDREFYVGPRALIEPETKQSRAGGLISDPKKNQGWLVVTPFKLSDTGDIILVNRGWVPQKLRPQERRSEGLPTGEVELDGVVRLTEPRPVFMMKNMPETKQWMYRDLDSMSAYAGSSPVWLDARGVPDPLPGWPIPNQTRVTLRNEHFSYLLTWFSLSGITGYMWYRRFVKKLPMW